jgi:hypothetical protein
MQRGHVLVAGGVGLLVVAVALVAVRPWRADPAPSAGTVGKIPSVLDVPCPGHPTTFDQARVAMAFPLELPDDPLARDATMKEVFECGPTQVAFVYASGVVIYLSENTLEDPEAVWQKMADLHPEFSTGVVRGVPASLVDPAKATGAEGGVDLVENGIRLTVSGNGTIPLDDLVRVTESVRPLGSPSPSAGELPSTG